jgi:hypothetical protein
MAQCPECDHKIPFRKLFFLKGSNTLQCDHCGVRLAWDMTRRPEPSDQRPIGIITTCLVTIVFALRFGSRRLFLGVCASALLALALTATYYYFRRIRPTRRDWVSTAFASTLALLITAAVLSGSIQIMIGTCLALSLGVGFASIYFAHLRAVLIKCSDAPHDAASPVD